MPTCGTQVAHSLQFYNFYRTDMYEKCLKQKNAMSVKNIKSFLNIFFIFGHYCISIRPLQVLWVIGEGIRPNQCIICVELVLGGGHPFRQQDRHLQPRYLHQEQANLYAT